jgi:hypothetical protein
VKKHWLTIVEIGLALVGLVAWILSNNIYVAMGAAFLMFAFGVTKPILDALKSARAQRYTNQQFDRAESRVNEQLESLLADLPQPMIPPRSIVQAMMRKQLGSNAAQQLDVFDAVVEELESDKTLIEMDSLICQLHLPFLARHLQGIAALRFSDYAVAAARFRENVQQQPDWADAWFGWLFCEFALGNREVILQNNPQLNGVEMLPFAPADQDCFIELNECDRQQVVDGFQSALRGIGDLYAACAIHQSRDQILQSRDEYHKAA